MAVTIDEREFRTRMQRLEGLLHEAERGGDPAAQSRLREIVQTILDLHSVGLDRLMERIAQAGEAGRDILDACIGDELVSGLLLLHGLHPLDLETRLHQALEGVRPYLQSHGGNVELVGIRDGVVYLRLQGSCHSCPSSAATMRQTVEEAIYGRAPEVIGVELEEELEDESPAQNGQARVALPLL